MQTLIATLPYVSQISPLHDPDAPPIPVCVWKDDDPCCEFRDDAEPCDFAGGIVYGSDSRHEPTFRPLHYYKMHFQPHPAYTLVPIPTAKE